jgi:hypothetical protein
MEFDRMRGNRTRLFAVLLPGLVLVGCSVRHSPTSYFAKSATGKKSDFNGQNDLSAEAVEDSIWVGGSAQPSTAPNSSYAVAQSYAAPAQQPASQDPAQAYPTSAQAYASSYNYYDGAAGQGYPQGYSQGYAHAYSQGYTPTAEGFYAYLRDTGFPLSSPTSLGSSEDAKNVLTFVLANGGHAHRMRVYEFDTEQEARGLQAVFNTHRLAAACGPLVLSADFPLPDGQTVAGLENAFDIYIAKAQNGLLSETRLAAEQSGEVHREPVKAVRNMFMLSRDAVVYSNPTTASNPIASVAEDSYVRVIDLMPNFLKVRLVDGNEGFLPEHAVEMH